MTLLLISFLVWCAMHRILMLVRACHGFHPRLHTRRAEAQRETETKLAAFDVHLLWRQVHV